jgi:hypothetical protein
MAFCTAGFIAVAMDYVAHDGLGFSRETIRDAAILSAGLLATLLAIDYLSRRIRRAD